MFYLCAMKLQEWINTVLNDNLVCERYADDLRAVTSKSKLLDVALDVNGFPFIMDMGAKGFPLPYETIMTELKSYINGRYIVTKTGKSGKSYTTSAYCCYSDSVAIDIVTTATMFFGCNLDVYVKENDFVRLYCDPNTSLRVHCPKNARCIVELWGNATVEVCGNYSRVEIIDNNGNK